MHTTRPIIVTDSGFVLRGRRNELAHELEWHMAQCRKWNQTPVEGYHARIAQEIRTALSHKTS